MAKVAQYLLGRLAGAFLTLLVGGFAVFLVMKAAPGDPALVALGEHATPDAVAAFRLRHNLDDPFLVQFWAWLQRMLVLDFGRSLTIAGGVSISKLFAFRVPNTAFIGIYALTFALLIALSMGTLSALQRGRVTDAAATSVAVVGISMPDFWLGYVLILVFALELQLLPSYGFTPLSQSLEGALLTGLLPALAIAAPMAAVFSRTLRASLLEHAHKDYVNVARSMGFSTAFIFVFYVFRNSIIPFIVVVGLQVRYLLGGVVVIERVFGVPGLGSLMVDAAFARDYPVVQACAISFLGTVLLVNLIVDVVCALLDPRRTR